MEEGAKRRLAGAAVAVVLLVIFVPMLLEENTKSPVPESEMSIPPKPDFERDYDTSVAGEPVQPSVPTSAEPKKPAAEGVLMPRESSPPALFDAPVTAEPELESGSDGELGPEFDLEPAPEPEPAPVSAKQEPAPQTKKKPTLESASVSKPPRAPEPAAERQRPASESPPKRSPAGGQKTAKLSSWVIQVASMQDRNHAYSLVQKLRKDGYPAYLEEAQVSGKLWHRVRVGPEMDRKEIESMAAALKDKTHLSVQIQRYR